MDLDFNKIDIKLSFNSKEIKYNDLLTKEETSTIPIIKFNKEEGKSYTIIIIDPDAPYPTKPIYKYMLHMLVTNNDNEVVKYMGPNPPADSAPHRYYTCIFEQESLIANTKKFHTRSRSNFDLKQYVLDNKLKIIGCFKFRVKIKSTI
jgi:phosphatidylethanolamine-binding protein (PEBP) family uncharacterized protein